MTEETNVPVEGEEAELGSEENPMTREQAIEADIDVEKVEAEAVPFTEEETDEDTDHA